MVERYRNVLKALCLTAACVVALAAVAGCGDDEPSTDRPDDGSPETVAAQFVDGVVAGDPDTCALLTDNGVMQVEVVTGAESCASALEDSTLVKSIFGVEDAGGIQSGVETAQVQTRGDYRVNVVIDLSGGRKILLAMVQGGDGWQVEVVRQSKVETISAGG